MAYFAIGTTLAGMVNMETYTGADTSSPPASMPRSR